jgi:cell fate (sporulation/competence/biofilm development) regulator YmcA (YheA/YmcA/DUF963 family)
MKENTMNEKETIRTIVRTLYDFQDMRVRMGNRLKKKKDGSSQENAEDIDLEQDAMPIIIDVWKSCQENEKKLLKALENELKEIPIYRDFLKDVKGCGPLMSGVIISEYDIHKATTVSKLWQFTGLNPGMVYGIKGEGSKKDGTFKIVKTTELVRGDKRTAGYLSPFNGWLRVKMVGVLAGSFIKSRSPYRKFYDDYKARLEREENTVMHIGKETAWKNVSTGHRDSAAKRYMIKMFLADLYQAWRTLEGLPVREPYQSEYLGKKHSA